MALINRMSRLFTADVHAVLDRIEEPDVLLKHAVREMEEELARGEQRVRSSSTSTSARRAAAQGRGACLSELGEQLDVCFDNGNDELARKVIKRRLETERLERHVAERRATSRQGARRARARPLEEQREQLDVMRQKAELLDGDVRPATTSATTISPSARTRSKSRSCASGRRGSRHERRANRTPRSAQGSAPRCVLSVERRRAARRADAVRSGQATALRAVIALLGFAYVLYVVGRERRARRPSHDDRAAGSSSRAQRGSWACRSSATCWFTSVSSGSCALFITTRACCPRCADLGLSALGAAFAAWAAQRSGSAWLALWCFFLVQAFHVCIPAHRWRARQRASTPTDDAFSRAHRAAEAAVRRLSSSVARFAIPPFKRSFKHENEHPGHWPRARDRRRRC